MQSSSLAWGDFDGDGDLDLAVGSKGNPNRIYRNDNGTLTATTAWSSAESDATTGVAWGDYDLDGDLDLAAGNSGQPDRIYRNDSGVLGAVAVWSSAEVDSGQSVAWGDVDNDGDLDLYAGQFYRNDLGQFTAVPEWSHLNDNVRSVVWGDYDGDGDLDQAFGVSGYSSGCNCYFGGGVSIVRNDGGHPGTTTTLRSTDNVWGLAWNDFDLDGDLDLGAANLIGFNSVLINAGGVLTDVSVWTSTVFSASTSVAWGDFDLDGDADVVFGQDYGAQSKLYRNDNGTLTNDPVWISPETYHVSSLAWGDMDGDGDADLAIADSNGPVHLYLNTSSALVSDPWRDGMANQRSVAWGDYDSDGDLDLAVGTQSGSWLLRNDHGVLVTPSVWSPLNAGSTTSLAWGDIDGDSDLDLVTGQCCGQASRLYLNTDGALSVAPAWTATLAEGTQSVALGDYDADGDLDLAVGNSGSGSAGQPNRLYRNDAGILTPNPVWTSVDNDATMSVAWGDVDGDGDLDLAVGNNTQPNRLYRNDNGTLMTSAIWSSQEVDATQSVAWADVDGDGDLDLAVGNLDGQNRLYMNQGGMLEASASWSSAESEDTRAVTWGDFDADGDPDLAVSNADLSNSSRPIYQPPVQLYRNDNGALTLAAAWTAHLAEQTYALAWGDMDGDGDLDLAAGNYVVYDRGCTCYSGGYTKIYRNLRNSRGQIGALPTISARGPGVYADYHSTANWVSGMVSINYELRSPTSNPVKRVVAYYSTNGGGLWRPAVPAAGSVTTNLSSSSSGVDHVFVWDTGASGFFGQSDDVVVRLIAIPTIQTQAGSTSGPYVFGGSVAQTYPLRVRGTQVQVVTGGTAVKGAQVYLVPAGTSLGGQPLSDQAGRPYLTDGQGYLQGHGQVAVGDQLVALSPMTTTAAYTVYATSASPNATGLAMYTVSQLGTQVLTVSMANPLAVFDLDVSLEWDARSDAVYMDQLAFDFEKAADVLYDVTNGQITLGEIRINHAQANAVDADVRIFSTNALRPYALIGGVVLTTTTEMPTTGVITYTPGQVIMGSSWNRYGDPGVRLGEDYARTLAHELGHWMLFQDDDYLGLDGSGHLQPVDTCTGTMMADAYLDANSELHPDSDWISKCGATLAQLTWGRSDWATLKAHYPWIKAPLTGLDQINPGPSAQPLSLTRVKYVEPATPPNAMADPRFFLKDSSGSSVIPGRNARVIRFGGIDELLYDQGRPVLDQIVAVGAAPGDRICVVDTTDGRIGCKPITVNDNQVLTLTTPISVWRPDVRITVPTSRTVSIQVSAVPQGLALRATLYGADTVIRQPLAAVNGGYGATVSTGDFTIGDGQVLVEVISDANPNTRRLILSEYTLGGNIIIDRNPNRFDRNPNRYDRNPNRYDRNPNRFDRNAPAISGDGNLIVYAADVVFASGSYYAIQEATTVPNVPVWATQVGKAYWLTASILAPALDQASLSLAYAQVDVPTDLEEWLKLYRWDGTTWTPLVTRVQADDNTVIAQAAGPGLYALMAAVELPLYGPGWNNIAYPIRNTTAITNALASIQGKYTVVYGYSGATGAWSVYGPGLPSYVNDLRNLEYGKAYWVNATQSTVLKLNPAPDAVSAGGYFPPATIYGRVWPSTTYHPVAGMQVDAYIDDHLCGSSSLASVGGSLTYVIKVLSDAERPGCGASGREVRLFLDGRETVVTQEWDNTRVREVPLGSSPILPRVFLPLIRN